MTYKKLTQAESDEIWAEMMQKISDNSLTECVSCSERPKGTPRCSSCDKNARLISRLEDERAAVRYATLVSLQVDPEVIQAAVNVLFVTVERNKWMPDPMRPGHREYRRLYVMADGSTTYRAVDRDGNIASAAEPIEGNFTEYTLCLGKRKVTFFVEAPHRPRSVEKAK